jgi:hypothetical protein
MGRHAQDMVEEGENSSLWRIEVLDFLFFPSCNLAHTFMVFVTLVSKEDGSSWMFGSVEDCRTSWDVVVEETTCAWQWDKLCCCCRGETKFWDKMDRMGWYKCTRWERAHFLDWGTSTQG